MTSDRAALVKALGIELPDELLTMALTHRSYSYENGGVPTNERLECVLVRSDNEAVVVNLDIEPAERPERVLWVDPIHKAPKQSG